MRVTCRWARICSAVPKCTEAGGVHPDPGVSVFVVVGGEEAAAECAGVFQ